MEISSALYELEKAAQTARYAARLVAVALTVTGFIVLFQAGPLPALALAMAAATTSHTATTIGALLRSHRHLADDLLLDRDIIASQNEVIALLREDRR